MKFVNIPFSFEEKESLIFNSNFLEIKNRLEIKNKSIYEKNIFLDNLFNFKTLSLGYERIHEISLKEYSMKDRVCFIGGNHSLSYQTMKSFSKFSKSMNKEPCLIIFDSNFNLKVSESLEFPKRDEWVYSLIKIGFNPKNILFVGIRDFDKEEYSFLERFGIKYVSIENLFFNLEGRTDYLMEFGYDKNVYVSIDLGVVDPVFVPGAISFEPGGISSRELLYIIKRIKKMKNLFALDIVEINLLENFHPQTKELVVRIIEELG